MGIDWYEVHYILHNYEEIDKHIIDKLINKMLYCILCKTYVRKSNLYNHHTLFPEYIKSQRHTVNPLV